MSNTDFTHQQAAKQTGQIFGKFMESYDSATDTQTMVYYKVNREQLSYAGAWYFLIATGTGFVPFPHIDTLPKELRKAAYRYMYTQGLKPSECARIVHELTNEEEELA